MPVSDTYANTVSQRKVHRLGLTHVPSRPRFGLGLVLLLTLSWGWLLLYAAFDWQWQQDLGRWNLYLAAATSFGFALVLRLWKNDPRRSFSGFETPTGD